MLFLATNVNDGGRPMRRGVARTCERSQRGRRTMMERENNVAKRCYELESKLGVHEVRRVHGEGKCA